MFKNPFRQPVERIQEGLHNDTRLVPYFIYQCRIVLYWGIWFFYKKKPDHYADEC